MLALHGLFRYSRTRWVLWSQQMAFDSFGDTDPRLMPAHLFWDCLHLDYSSAVRADITRQNYTVCPRHWYISATFKCEKCGNSFEFTAEEQRFWYEDLQFFIESVPRHCTACRKNLRLLKSLHKEYDARIGSALSSDDLAEKRRLITIIDGISEASSGLPTQIGQKRRALERQISRRGGLSDT